MSRAFLPLLAIAVLSAGLLAADRKFAEPLNIAKELEAILAEFPDDQSKPARDAALTQLAAAAEAAKPTDYASLAALRQIYVKLGRLNDVVRVQTLMSESMQKEIEKSARPDPSQRVRPPVPNARGPLSLPAVNRPEPTSKPGEFDLRGELQKIDAQFNIFSAFPPTAPREGPEYEKFMADRKAAFSALAAAAEAAKVTDHAALARLYGTLERYDDAAREVRAQMAEAPQDLNGYWALLNYLCKAKRTDEALAAFRQWLAVEVSLSDTETYLKPLENGAPSPVRSLVILLLVEGRYDDAAQVRGEMRKKVEMLLAQYDKGPVPENLKRPTISNALGNIASLAGHILDFEVQMQSRSDLRIKFDGIVAKFPLGIGRGKPLSGPEAERRIADRKAALSELAASPVAAQSSDFSTLVKLYSLVDRTDDALDAQRRWLSQDVPLADVLRFLKHLEIRGGARDLIESLIRQGKFAEGWQVTVDLGSKLDQFLARYDQGPAPDWVKRPDITNAMLDVIRLQQILVGAEVKSYVAAGKSAQAEQALDRWQAFLSRWAGTFSNPQSLFHQYQQELNAERAALKN